MMELGIFSRTYEGTDLETTYQKMTEHGIFHTQINLLNAGIATLPESITDKKLEEIKILTKKYKIEIDALSGTFNMIDIHSEAREKGIVQFETQCKVAKDLQIPIVTLCTGSKNPNNKWEWHDDNLSDHAWTDLMRTTERIIRFAEDNHVCLGVETETGNIINSAAKARKYLDMSGSKNLKIIMDGANLLYPKQLPYFKDVWDEAFDLLGKDIIIAHAKDFIFDGKFKFVAPGQGMLDFRYYIKKLNDIDYKGALVMHGLSEEQVPESCKFLKMIFEKNN